ncbi:uncharacterized protein G2W53_012563 [Senna tora]|uniref:Uncharacterized protein n=1 Tax=Senna tora TaxID=362788 RepID=A0A834U1I0_9FABA|nr:uncharacterized protein G2W53_012563 [Senna tora]
MSGNATSELFVPVLMLDLHETEMRKPKITTEATRL